MHLKKVPPVLKAGSSGSNLKKDKNKFMFMKNLKILFDFNSLCDSRFTDSLEKYEPFLN